MSTKSSGYDCGNNVNITSLYVATRLLPATANLVSVAVLLI